MRRMLIAGKSAQGAIKGCLFALLLWMLGAAPAAAQLINMGANHHNVGFSYYESIGTNFGFYFPGQLNSRGHGIVGLMPNGQFTPDGNIWFTQGGGVIPPFGGFDPNAGLNTGWAVRGPNGGFNFRLSAAQGSSMTLGGDSMLLTVPNGGSGFIQSGTFRPFVTGIVPVLGGGPTYVPPLTATSPLYRSSSEASRAPRTGTKEALKSGSSAERGASSLAALRAQADAEDAATEAARVAEMEKWVEKAKAARKEGKESLAASYLRSALKRATVEEAERIEAGWRAE